MLSLTLSPKISSLEQALNENQKSELLSPKTKNGYKCEKCNKVTDAKKRQTIDKAPFTLIVHLKRYDAKMKKVNQQIKFPEKFNLK